MSWDDDYRNRTYPGRRAPPPDLSEEAQFHGLGPREGDERPRVPLYPNARWGATELLSLGKSATLVVTPIFDLPCPIGFQLRFSLDGAEFSSEMPVDRGIDVTLTKSFDPKAGPAREIFPIDPGDAQPMCQVIARSLTITVRSAETSLGELYIQAVACPLTALDCAVAVPAPPPGVPAGFDVRTIARYAAVTATTYNIAAEPRRAYTVFANQSAANLYVALGNGVTITPGNEFATIVLPPNSYAGYEVLGWQGELTFRFDADDTDGYVLVTQGLYPP